MKPITQAPSQQDFIYQFQNLSLNPNRMQKNQANYPIYNYNYYNFYSYPTGGNYFGMGGQMGQMGQEVQPFYQQNKMTYPKKKEKLLDLSPNAYNYVKYEPVENKDFESINKSLDIKFENSGFYIIKSYNDENVIKSVKYNIWSSTKNHNTDLDSSFQNRRTFLFFSINGSGQFYGVAEMTSKVLFDNCFEGWSQKDKWFGVFTVNWLFLKDIPNKEFKEIKNSLNFNKPVHNSRDCQEIPFEEGMKMLKIFEKNQNQSSILARLLQ